MNEIMDTWRKYEAGKNYNLKLNLYDVNDRNERYYAGDQWYGVNAPGVPQPVFNIFKRIINYFIAATLQQPAKLRFFPLLASEDASDEEEQLLNVAADLISDYSETLMERLKMDTKSRELLLDAAITGDMCTYLYWDQSIETGQELRGDINLEVIDSVNLFYGNPNDKNKERQPYIILAFRELTETLKKEAKDNGIPKEEYERILPDLDNQYTAGDRGKDELDTTSKNLSGTGKTTALIKLFKKEGVVYAEKCTKHSRVRKEWNTKLTKYPTPMNNWDSRKNSYHGQALGTGIIPNQNYINKQFSLIMIFMRELGFPKVIYDKTYISAWSNMVGGSFGVETAGQVPLGNIAQYMTPAQMNTQMLNTIDMAISYTKEFLGANDAALGDLKADNARALAIVTEQAAVPLANIRANLYQLFEDIGYSMLDFMANYYGKRKVTIIRNGKRVVEEFDFDKLKELNLRIKVEVTPGTLFNELAAQETLDNLLREDRINFLQWLDRTRPGLVPKKQELMDEIREQEQIQAQEQEDQAYIDSLQGKSSQELQQEMVALGGQI